MEIRSVNLKEFTISSQNNDQAIDQNIYLPGADAEKATNNIKEPKKDLLFRSNAVFAVDSDNHVVIQLLDENGEIIKQIPPEVYLDMLKKLNVDAKSHYDIVA